MSTRRKAREFALRALYAHEMSKNSIDYIIKDLLTDDECLDIKDFCADLVRLTVKHTVEFDKMIKQKALNWDFERIAILDRIILRIAMCEFLYFGDIPPKVSIDEAIEIAKIYSTEKSGKFVNGILDSVLSDWQKQKKINKSGRGLFSDSIRKKNEPFKSSLSKNELA
ncbi:transcription antitermination factor NusB [candidate division KSB1 bacterium]|nr:transcription antitermination factor NusB [candidate division KSB1 bacterium]